ncbi:hypothetical protein OF389_09900, partial [Companilactobacillus farciminis]|nr:hypothetical protein [Companilactobacillus farciminis]
KNNDGISLQVLQKDAESDDGFVNKYGDVDEIKKGSYTDSKIVTLNFNKLNKMPKETNKSAKQFVYGLKNKSFSSLNEFYQSVEFDNYSSDDKVMKADLDNLQDGYTSDNENPKIKYAFIIDEKSDAGDSYYVFATDGKKVYYSDKLDDSNSKVEEWQDRSPLNN